MIKIIVGFFTKDREDYNNPVVRKIYGVVTGAVGIVLNMILFVAKLILGSMTGAISITADALNNLSDAASSMLSFISFHVSDKHPDKEHPFGHGRVEYVAGFAIALLIMVMAVELFKSSIYKIITPEPVESSIISIFLLAAAIVMKIYMAAYNRVYGNKINSETMRATSIDSMSDVIVTSVVLISMVVIRHTGLMIDGYIGIVVSLFVLYAGLRAIKDTIDPLLGRQPDNHIVGEIDTIVSEFPEILGYHDLVIHDYGPGRCMVTFDVEVSENSDFKEIHEVVDNCQKELHKRLRCESVIHMDPVAVDNPEVDLIKNEIMSEIRKLDDKITIHDFRITDCSTHKKISFDAVLPEKCSLTKKEAKEKLEAIVSNLEHDCKYEAAIQIDIENLAWQD